MKECFFKLTATINILFWCTKNILFRLKWFLKGQQLIHELTHKWKLSTFDFVIYLLFIYLAMK